MTIENFEKAQEIQSKLEKLHAHWDEMNSAATRENYTLLGLVHKSFKEQEGEILSGMNTRILIEEFLPGRGPEMMIEAYMQNLKTAIDDLENHFKEL